jgi:hypothetical protein
LKECYLIVLNCFREIPCSCITNLITGNIQCCQCLYEMKTEMNIKQIHNIWKNVTWLFWIALARCSAPTLAIVFHERFSVVNVCVKWRSRWIYKKYITFEEMLPDYFELLERDTLLLHRKSHQRKDIILLKSVWNEDEYEYEWNA